MAVVDGNGRDGADHVIDGAINVALAGVYLHSFGCTYLLVRTDLYLQYLQENFTKETTNRVFQQMNKATEMIYNANGYAVYRLIPPR